MTIDEFKKLEPGEIVWIAIGNQPVKVEVVEKNKELCVLRHPEGSPHRSSRQPSMLLTRVFMNVEKV